MKTFLALFLATSCCFGGTWFLSTNKVERMSTCAVFHAPGITCKAVSYLVYSNWVSSNVLVSSTLISQSWNYEESGTADPNWSFDNGFSRTNILPFMYVPGRVATTNLFWAQPQQ